MLQLHKELTSVAMSPLHPKTIYFLCSNQPVPLNGLGLIKRGIYI